MVPLFIYHFGFFNCKFMLLMSSEAQLGFLRNGLPFMLFSHTVVQPTQMRAVRLTPLWMLKYLIIFVTFSPLCFIFLNFLIFSFLKLPIPRQNTTKLRHLLLTICFASERTGSVLIALKCSVLRKFISVSITWMEKPSIWNPAPSDGSSDTQNKWTSLEVYVVRIYMSLGGLFHAGRVPGTNNCSILNFLQKHFHYSTFCTYKHNLLVPLFCHHWRQWKSLLCYCVQQLWFPSAGIRTSLYLFCCGIKIHCKCLEAWICKVYFGCIF